MLDRSAALAAASRCTRCGNCQYYCPTYNTNRIESYTARGRLQLIHATRVKPDFLDSSVFLQRLNQCLLCGNCSEICPSGITTEDIITAYRSDCIMRQGVPAALARTRGNIVSSGSITGDEPQNRLLWLKNIEGQIRPLKIFQPAEYAYLTGCVPALYPSAYSIPQSFVRILQKADIDFTLPGDSETCCGYPLYIGGLFNEAKASAEKNVALLQCLGIRKILTTCPSCFHMWHDLYPELLGYRPDFELIHGTQILDQLIAAGQLPLKEVKRVITFHDPCDLGRKIGVYDAPRRVLASIPGIELREMKHTRAEARCCGGGGNMEMNDQVLGGKVAQDRVSQAMDTGAASIVSACQQCKRTLSGAARQMRARVRVHDISEVVAEALVD